MATLPLISCRLPGQPWPGPSSLHTALGGTARPTPHCQQRVPSSVTELAAIIVSLSNSSSHLVFAPVFLPASEKEVLQNHCSQENLTNGDRGQNSEYLGDRGYSLGRGMRKLPEMYPDLVVVTRVCTCEELSRSTLNFSSP